MATSCRRSAASVAARALVALAVAFLSVAPAHAQIAGDNVNMVTGTEWPGGDPFLQRQNEPSIAVSSANPQHLFAGANDYRSVDLPAPKTEASPRTGDAWLGVFKSLDGGQTWHSTLLPGYPQQASTACAPGGPQPPTCGFQAAADPVVRAGTDGMFYFAGLAFDRSRKHSRVFVARYLDRNDRERVLGAIDSADDPIEYLGIGAVPEDGKLVDATNPTTSDLTFLDKPWIAVDMPRGGAAKCTVKLKDGTTRSFVAGTVYVAYVKFVKGQTSGALYDKASQVMLAKSEDCGVSFSAPVALTDASSSAMNEGPAVAIDPTTGKVYVVWRRVAFGTQSDAIMVSRSFSRGWKFTKPRLIAALPAAAVKFPWTQPSSPFDHGIPADPGQFRAWALPTFAISVGAGGNRHLHVAWAQRDAQDRGRVVISTANVSPPPASGQEVDENDSSADHWSAPAAVDADPASPGRSALVGTDGTKLQFLDGHQLMPALTFSQGRLVLVYYDSRFDHARSLFQPNGADGRFVPDAEGRFYRELKAPTQRTTGAWDWDPLATVFGPYWNGPPRIDDDDVFALRHTVDVRVATALPGPAPAFSSVQVSRYPMGRRGDEASFLTNGHLSAPGFLANNGRPDTDHVEDAALQLISPATATAPAQLKLLQQLRQNPPNLPLFAGGTSPFMGDYLDIQGPAFVRSGNGWDFNTAPVSSPVFHAVWTSNQDVRRPPPTCPASNPSCSPDQMIVDWTKYTPVAVNCTNGSCTRVFDGANSDACAPGFEGTRDQNIYTARITEGLLVSSPQNAKALNASAYRTFVVLAQNSTWKQKNVRFTVMPSNGVVASLRAPGASVATTADAAIPPRSHVFRTVTAYLAGSASPSASIDVRVDELDPACDVTRSSCSIASGGASGFVTLNPPGSPASLFAASTDQETYDPMLIQATLTPADPMDGQADVASHDIASHDIASHDIASHDIASHDIASHDIASHDIEVVENASHDIASHDIASHDIASHDIEDLASASHDIASHDIASHDIASMSDLSYTYRNDGTTTAAYDVVVAGTAPTYTATDGATRILPVQLIVSKAYRTPVVSSCQLQQRSHTQVVANIPDVSGAIVPLDAPFPPNVLDASATHATVSVAPGEEIYVTLRAVASLKRMAEIARALQVIATPQGNPMSIAPPCEGTACSATTVRDVVQWAGTSAAPKSNTTTTVSLTGADGQWFDAAVDTNPNLARPATGKVTFVLADAMGSRLLGVADLEPGTCTMEGCTIPPSYARVPSMTALDPSAVVTAYYGGDADHLPSSGTWPQVRAARLVVGTSGLADLASAVAVAPDGTKLVGITSQDATGESTFVAIYRTGAAPSAVPVPGEVGGFAFDGAGNTYVTGWRSTVGGDLGYLLKLDQAGALAWTVDLDGIGQSVAYDRARRVVWVAGGVSPDDQATLRVFDPAGNFLRSAGVMSDVVGEAVTRSRGMTVALDAFGNAYVNAAAANGGTIVEQLDPDQHLVWVRRLGTVGVPSWPRGLSLSPDGTTVYAGGDDSAVSTASYVVALGNDGSVQRSVSLSEEMRDLVATDDGFVVVGPPYAYFNAGPGFAARYGAASTPMWHVAPTGVTSIRGIARDAAGDLVIVGEVMEGSSSTTMDAIVTTLSAASGAEVGASR